MIILDTCALIFDALSPEKLSSVAKRAIDKAEKQNQLFCSDISLWEVAMLVQKKRLNPGVEAQAFLNLMLQARQIEVLSITMEIAVLSASLAHHHADSADCLITATAIYHGAGLVTCDKKIAGILGVEIIW